MSKINTIQNKILELNGGQFQKLADLYLKAKGFQHINSIGSVYGKDKTRSGTPDSLISLPNGKYIFVEHTTNESNLFNKLKDDINKCLDVEKHGIPIEKIYKIILCHTERLDPNEENELRELGGSDGVPVEFFNLEDISHDLYLRFPKIAKDELGVSIDTGQIVRPVDFIKIHEDSKYSTPLSLVLQFREDEKENALQKLAEHNLLILSGPAGVGKTRLALEVAKDFKSVNSDFNIWCMFKRTADLWDDIQHYFSTPDKYLIIVDDANRINSFSYVIDFIKHASSSHDIKIIATVRDYALSKVKSDAYLEVDFNELNIKPLTDDQIKEIVKEQFEISNHLFLERIVQIAKGNPRLAVMAANVAKEEDSILAISDVSELYDQYFKSVHDDIFNDVELKEKTDVSSLILLKTASITSFFKAVDRDNEEMMSLIEKVLGISKNEYWEAALYLHEIEFIDMYENIVRMSDQVLGTYFFYQCFFKKNLIDFGTLLNHTFPQFNNRIVDSLNPVLSAFDHQSILESLRPVIGRLTKHYRREGDIGAIHDLLETFWFVNETDTLVFAKSLIEEMPSEKINIEQVHLTIDNNSPPNRTALSLLKPFSNANMVNVGISIDLILDYAEKNPSDMPMILGVLSRDFGFKLYSYRRRFEVQELVIDKLFQRISKGNKLFKYVFLSVAGQFLKTQFESSEMKNNRAVQFTRFPLPLSSDTKQLRSKIWQQIFELGAKDKYKDDVLKLVQGYSHSYMEFDEEKKLIEWESDLLLSYLINVVNISKYKDVYVFQNYLDLLDQNEVAYDESLREHITNDIYQISEIFLSEWRRSDPEKHTGEEYHLYKKAQLKDFIDGYTIQEFIKLIDAFIIIRDNPTKRRVEYLLKQRLELVITILSEINTDLFLNAIKYYLTIGDPFKVSGKIIVDRWISYEKPKAVLDSIKEFSFPNKDRWVFWIYEALPENEITEAYTKNLYELYSSTDAQFLSRDWNFLIKYSSKDSKVVETTLQILIKRTQDDPEVVSAMDMLFMNFNSIETLIRDASADFLKSLKKAYILVSSKERHIDYNGKTFNILLDRDIYFISEFVDTLYPEGTKYISNEDYRDFTFIWKRDDYKTIIDIVVDRVFKNEQKLIVLRNTNLEMFFDANFRKNTSKEDQEKQFDYLKERIIAECSNIDFLQYLFRVIKKFPTEKRRDLIELFLSCNQSYSDFKSLDLEPSSWSGIGSMVPVYAGRIEFFESLLQLMNKPKLLFHKKHVEERIESLKEDMTWEKKRDFLED